MVLDARFDEKVGARIRRIREAVGMSQVELANRLAESGFAFRQQTVAKVESGQRPLKLEEALVVALILDVSDEAIWDIDATIDQRLAVISAVNEVAAAWDALERAVVALESAKRSLRLRAEAWADDIRGTEFEQAKAYLQADPNKIVSAKLKSLDLETLAENALAEAAVPMNVQDDDQ